MADDPTTPPEPGIDPTTPPINTPPKDETVELKAELAKWREMAKKSESLAKSNAAAAEKLAKIEEASKSELERAQAAAAEADQRAKAAEDRIARALTKAAVSAAAVRAGAIDADAVHALLPADSITVDGDDVKGVDEAVDALRKAKPYLFGRSKPAPGSADGGRQGDKQAQWTREDLKGKSSAEIEAARKAGLLNNVMSGAA